MILRWVIPVEKGMMPLRTGVAGTLARAAPCSMVDAKVIIAGLEALLCSLSLLYGLRPQLGALVECVTAVPTDLAG